MLAQDGWRSICGPRVHDRVGPEAKVDLPPTRRDDPDRNAAWIKEYYDCMLYFEKYAGFRGLLFYRLPNPRRPAPGEETLLGEKNEAYMYVFLHVPDQRDDQVSCCTSRRSRGSRASAGRIRRWDPEIVHNWNTGPLVDMTENAFASVKWHIVHQHPPQQFGGGGMRRSYDAGHRAVGKGPIARRVRIRPAPCRVLHRPPRSVRAIHVALFVTCAWRVRRITRRGTRRGSVRSTRRRDAPSRPSSFSTASGPPRQSWPPARTRRFMRRGGAEKPPQRVHASISCWINCRTGCR